MSDRVLLGALGGGDYGLRVSRPGYDVTDPALAKEQLAFDSRWTEVSNVWMAGSVVFTPSGTTVSYGTTFAVPPPVFGIVLISGRYHLFGTIGMTISNGPTGNVTSYTNRAIFYASGGSGTKLSYLVLRNIFRTQP